MSTPRLLPRAAPKFLVEGALDRAAAAAVEAFHLEGQSENTRRAYAQCYRYWGAWYALRYGRPLTLPVSADVVCQFLVDHLKHQAAGRRAHLLPEDIDRVLIAHRYKQKPGSLSLATVEQRLAALSVAHEQARPSDAADGFNPVRAEAVRRLLSSIRRAYAKRGDPRRQPKAATRDALEAMLATCDDSPRGVRDRALLLFGFASGGRRRSEITAATFENVTRQGDGYVYQLRRSKTNQGGRADPSSAKPIEGVAALALSRWLAELSAADIRKGPLFRRIGVGDVIGDGLAAAAVRDIVVSRAKRAGLKGYAAHSLRSGFVTEAGRRKIALGETMAMTGHRSVSTVMRYYQAGAVGVSQAARLMDDQNDG